jgi:hypothetical protein
MPNFNPRELEILESYKKIGIRPMSPALVAQFYELFLENYSCAEIARLNKGISEGDVLFAAEKFEWHRKRDEYAKGLQEQVGQKMAKQELESIVHLTNLISVAHKQHNEQMIKYLQTGKKEDLPDNSINSLKSYKDAIDLLQKITGKDKITKQEIKTENHSVTTFKIDPEFKKELTPQVKEALLEQMINEKEGKK